MAVDISQRGCSPLRALKDELSGLLDSNRLHQAIEICQRIIMIDPEDGMERLRLGRVLERLGRWREAHNAYREAVHLFEVANNFSRAKATCSLLIALRPDDAEAYRLRAQYARAERLSASDAQMNTADRLAQVEQCHGWGESEGETAPAR